METVKHLCYQVIARFDALLDLYAYIKLRLSACSTYGQSHETQAVGQ
jgi:hypothetical protein